VTDSVIQVDNLIVRYADNLAVDDLSFTVSAGEVLALLGPNGAGKTSTVRCLVGLQQPSAGTLRVSGIDVSANPVAAKQRIAYVPEHGSLYEVLTPIETLELKGRLMGLDEDRIRTRAEHLLDVLGIADRQHDTMAGFSKGMRQKVVFACMLLADADAYVLDEPLSGLDAETTQLAKELIRLLTEKRRAVLYCSHLLDVVERVADRILILAKGKRVAAGTLEELRSHEVVTSDPSLDRIFRNLTKAADPRAQAERLLSDPPGD